MVPERRRAIELLMLHQQLIARGVTVLANRLDPVTRKVDRAVAEGSSTNLLRVLAGYLETNDPEPLMEAIRTTAQLRHLTGYRMQQLMALSHCYLPVIRKIFQRNGDPELKAYDVVESVLLPFIVRMLDELYVRFGEHEFAEDEITANRKKPDPTEEPNPFTMVDVEEEITAES